MSTYTAAVRWTRDPSTDFAKGQYSRAQVLLSLRAKRSNPALLFHAKITKEQ